MTQPDIILIMADNQQAETLGCYGNSEISTPHLDALAARGMRFDKAFCPNAFCSPCRASVLTGRMPCDHGVQSWIDDRNAADWPAGWHALAGIETLPELLQQAGYRTGLFGKYHLGVTDVPAPGWDVWVTMADGHVRSFYDNKINENGRDVEQPGHAVDYFTDQALAFLGEPQDTPRFAFMPFPAPYGHWPATNDGNRNRFADLYEGCPMDTVPRHPIRPEAVAHYDRIKSHSGAGLDLSMLMRAPNDLATLRNYYSQISLIDDAVGRISAAHPDALIVYTADHGMSLGHHGFWGHGGATYPSNMHLAAHSIPLLMAGHGQVKTGISDLHINGTDLFSTLLDCAGAVRPLSGASRNFAPLLRGDDLPDWGADEVFAEQEETRVLRTPDYLYFKRIKHPKGPAFKDALFDLRTDPAENINLIDSSGHQQIAQTMSDRIDAYFERHGRPEADMWRGGRPIQNSMFRDVWRQMWGDGWAPVWTYAQ